MALVSVWLGIAGSRGGSTAWAQGLVDGGFEVPTLSGTNYQYSPTGSAWTYNGAALSRNGSGFTSANPDTPEGNQCAVIQQQSSIQQTISQMGPGTYHLNFLAAQRGGPYPSQSIEVFIDTTSLGVVTPPGTSYTGNSVTFTLSPGAGTTHTLKFVGLNPGGGDRTAFLDQVQLRGGIQITTGDSNINVQDITASGTAARAVSPVPHPAYGSLNVPWVTERIDPISLRYSDGSVSGHTFEFAIPFTVSAAGTYAVSGQALCDDNIVSVYVDTSSQPLSFSGDPIRTISGSFTASVGSHMLYVRVYNEDPGGTVTYNPMGLSLIAGVTQTSTSGGGGVTLQMLTVDPITVAGGTGSTGTVILSGPAPAGGMTITLSSNQSAASVPASVTVAQGNSSQTFPITTSAVATTTLATITGSDGTNTRTGGLTVQAPTLVSLALNPTSVTGGSPSSGTVTISSPAPSGGLSIALASGAPTVASVPASITIAPGQITSSAFTIGTSSVSSATSALITASLNGGQVTYTLSVQAGGGGSPPLTNDSQFIAQSVQTTMTAGQSYQVSVTMKNTGTATWTEANQYHLGSQNSQDNTRWGLNRVSLPTGTTSVTTGQQVTFTFMVTAPTTPGTHDFQWRMVQDGVEWFGDFTTNQAVEVVAAPVGVPGDSRILHLEDISIPKTIRLKWDQPVSTTGIIIEELVREVQFTTGNGPIASDYSNRSFEDHDWGFNTRYRYYLKGRRVTSPTQAISWKSNDVYVTVCQVPVGVNQSVDSRLDRRYAGNQPTFTDFNFQNTSYRGGLYAGNTGNGPDNSREGRAYLKFPLVRPTVVPSWEKMWNKGGLWLYFTRMARTGTSASVAALAMADTWDASSLVWTTQPATRGSIGATTAVNANTPNRWIRLNALGAIELELPGTGDGILSLCLLTQSGPGSWAYFARSDHKASPTSTEPLGAYLLYAFGGDGATADDSGNGPGTDNPNQNPGGGGE